MLRKPKGFTVVAALAPALGVGGASAMYSAVDGVLLRPPPRPEAERLVRRARPTTESAPAG